MNAEEQLHTLNALGRFVEGIQVIILLTMGQYLYANGGVQLNAPHWRGFTEFVGGEHSVGILIMGLGLIGLIGMFGRAISPKVHLVITWIFSILAAIFCWTVAGFQTYALVHDQAGNAGLWTWGLNGLFFLFSRTAITIGTNVEDDVHD